MKKMILSLMLVLNVIYIVVYLINFGDLLINNFWAVLFIVEIILSIVFLFAFKQKAKNSPLLPIAVLVTSISCLGAFWFADRLFTIMG